MKNRRSVLAVGAILLAVVLLIAFAVPFARTGVFYIALGFEIAAFLVALFAARPGSVSARDCSARIRETSVFSFTSCRTASLRSASAEIMPTAAAASRIA